MSDSTSNNKAPAPHAGDQSLGLAGWMTKSFIHSPLTLLFLIACLVIGILGFIITPRQEDPQIDVPMVDIFVRYPGASAQQVSSSAIDKLERMMSEIKGVEHVYSVSERGGGMVTVQFEVGQNMQQSQVKLYDKLASNLDAIPPGVLQPLVKPKAVDDVPVVTLTLWSDSVDDAGLRLVALEVMQRLKEVPETAQSFVIGGRSEQLTVEVMPERLSGFGIGVDQLAAVIGAANEKRGIGNVETGGRAMSVYTGRFLRHASDIESLVVGVRNGAPVYVRDVARVSEGPGEAANLVQYFSGPAAPGNAPKADGAAAVTIAVAKKSGSNGVTVAEAILRQVEALKGRVIPNNVNVAVTRDYGKTASGKVNELFVKLLIATGAVSALIWLFLGLRPTIVVGIIIPVVILVTVFSAWLIGYTIDRVSLFALIFSIGILVDDATVVVENIYRRWLMQGRVDTATTIDAVREVGNPTILATFTVIAALLPMGFVSGMMGPYMRPIPVLGSVAMLFSLFAAFMFTPWLAMRIRPSMAQLHKMEASEHRLSGRLDSFYRGMLGPLIDQPWKARLFRIGIWVAFLLCCLLFYTQHVAVKMLPMDNKPEFNVVVNMPEGTALPVTANVMQQLTAKAQEIPEVTALQTYVGAASPFNFNGLVRHYYLRTKPWQGDIQVQLTDKSKRKRSSHQLAVAAREMLTPLAKSLGARIAVVEMPPGPPVLQTVVAEVYGPDDTTRRQVARDLTKIFESAQSIGDVDNYLQAPHDTLVFKVDQIKAQNQNVSIADISRQLGLVMGGHKLGDAKLGHELEPRNIILQAPLEIRGNIARLGETPIHTQDNKLVPLSELGSFVRQRQDEVVFHKDLRTVEYVTGEAVGRLAAPVYAMIEVSKKLADYKTPDGVELSGTLVAPPPDSYTSGFEWTGEWTVTYETFRDMGLAFAAAMVLIYMLVVLEFGNFRLPGIIMAPIPLTLIGIIPGHWLLGAEFTATSMIGWIALAGIIVRNSILLVDFSKHAMLEGKSVREAVIEACRARTRPIVITSLALMAGSASIITDPIFQGMAISLLFGAAVSTALTLVVIPLACARANETAWSDTGSRAEKTLSTSTIASDSPKADAPAVATAGAKRRSAVAGRIGGAVAGGAAAVASLLSSGTDAVERRFGAGVARPLRLTGTVVVQGTANLLGMAQAPRRDDSAATAGKSTSGNNGGGGASGAKIVAGTIASAATGLWGILRQGTANLLGRSATGRGAPAAKDDALRTSAAAAGSPLAAAAAAGAQMPSSSGRKASDFITPAAPVSTKPATVLTSPAKAAETVAPDTSRSHDRDMLVVPSDSPPDVAAATANQDAGEKTPDTTAAAAPGEKDNPATSENVSAEIAHDLRQIKGIGRSIERSLHKLGVDNLHQIAAWTSADIERIGNALAFKGRIEREDWIGQAKRLLRQSAAVAAGARTTQGEAGDLKKKSAGT